MEMENENGKDVFGTKITYAVVVRGDISTVNELISFLKQSNLVVAHQQMGTRKLYIKEE